MQQSQAARLVLELALSSSRSSLLISVLGKTIVAASKENADAKKLTNGAARCRTQATLDILRASFYRDAYLIERLTDAYGSSDANMRELRSGPFMPIVRFLCERSRELETQCDASSLAKFGEIFRPVVDHIDAAVAEVPVKDSLFKGAQQSISQTIGDRGDSVLGVSHERASLELSASEFSGMHVAPNVIEDGGDALYFQMMLRMLRLVQEEEATGGGKSAGGASNQAKLLEFMGSIAKKRLKEKKSAAAATSAASTGSAHAQPAVSSAHPPKIPQGSLIPRTVSF
uniref:Uncharacterized protein n=1 Tax=Erythrolobus madagascarensis TaxID=708628 RepID=A0A7S0XJ83_9RHOD